MGIDYECRGRQLLLRLVNITRVCTRPYDFLRFDKDSRRDPYRILRKSLVFVKGSLKNPYQILRIFL